MTSLDKSNSPGVWINPETGGGESTCEWQDRLNAGDPAARRELAERADGSGWRILGRFLIVADTEDQANAACEALERAAHRSRRMAAVTIHSYERVRPVIPPDRSSSVLAFCTRCGYPASWHRLSDDDLGDLPDWRFRCLGYDCRADGAPPPGGRACDCPDYVVEAL